jgi:aryl-alcohol dehydrogenase-like predicted oxidoreductase
MSKVELGAGLIGIGRKWGHVETSIPSEEEVTAFLNFAYQNEIRYFDTAPAYGSSEQRLGKFLATLSTNERENVIVATKFGEHWNPESQTTYVDHSFDALVNSLDQSVKRLGKVDVLQVHKSSPDVLGSEDLYKAIDYAKKLGIQKFGASVSDIASAQIVCHSNVFSVVQLPYNSLNTTFSDVIQEALERDKLVVINRPFNMGETLYQTREAKDPQSLRTDAYKFIVNSIPMGLVLTGTKSISHLRENIDAFAEANK